MATETDKNRYLVNLQEERNSAFLYRALAGHEQNPKIAEVYRRLAEMEDAHAALWARKLEEGGGKVPEFRPSGRTRLLVWAARRFGSGAVIPALSSREATAAQDYGAQPEAAEMTATERSHARILSQIGRTTQGGLGGTALAQIEGRHRMSGGNALRAAVLGASDGLLSNFNLVMGVAGAELSGRNILLTGCAGLLAGAVSMALGEWISVQSSRELYQKQIRTEQEEIATMPEEETEELVLIYQARGMDEGTARLLATRIMADREHALDTMVREELGISPEDLGGSAWEAAFTSFVLFAVGAAIPVIPFALLSGTAAIATSAVMSAAALFVVGGAITLFTGRSVWYSGMRQVLFGLAAAATTFVIGRLVGIGLSG